MKGTLKILLKIIKLSYLTSKCKCNVCNVNKIFFSTKNFLRHYVDHLASGTGGIVYTGSYFYHRYDTTFIIRHDLNSSLHTQTELGGMAHRDCARITGDDDGIETREKRDENQGPSLPFPLFSGGTQ